MIPVLLYLFISAGTVIVAMRKFRVALAVGAVLVLLPLTLTGGALFRGEVYGPLDLAYVAEPFSSSPAASIAGDVANPAISDVYAQFFPWNEALRRAFRAGEWPHWNPFVLSGTPLDAAVQTSLYHPITIVRSLVPITSGITLAASLMYLLAAVSAFALAYELAKHQWAALVGAAAWMYSTTLIFFAGTALALSVAVMPLVLLAARRIVIAPGRRSGGLLLASLTLLLVGGHPESALHVVTFAVAFFVFTAATHRPIRWRSVLVTGIGAGVTTLLLCAVYLVPFFEAVTQSQEFSFRDEGYSELRLSSSTDQLLHRLRANFYPFLEGAEGHAYTSHSPATKHGWIGNFYPGWLTIALALCGVILSRSRDRWFLAGALIFGVAFAIGTPGLVELVQNLPLFNLGVNDRMVSYAALAAAMLAALGARELFESPRRGVVLMVAASLTVIAGALLVPSDLPIDFIRSGAARAMLPVVLTAAALLVMQARVVHVILVLLIVQRLGEAAWMQPSVPVAAFYPPFAGVEIMQTAEPSRVVGVGTMLVPNLTTHYGLEDVRGFEALTLLRYWETFPMWSTAQPVWSNRVDSLDSPFLSALNVKFAVAPPAHSLPEGWVERMRTPGYVIAENRKALPRAWIPAHVIYASREVTRSLIGRTGDFAAESWIEQAHGGSAVNGRGSVIAERNGSGLRLRASIATPAWVVISNSAWNGWRAVERGRELPVYIANHTMLAVRLTPGEHDIDLQYRPRSFAPAASVSAVTLLALAAFALMARFRARS